MSVRSINSFVTRRTRCQRQHSQSHKAPWAALPTELKERIIDLVENPTLTGRVSRDLQNLSTHSYTVLLNEYETHPALMSLLAFPQHQVFPVEQVRVIYQTIMRKAKYGEVDLQDFKTEGSPLHTTRLVQIQKFTCLRLTDKAVYFKSLFDWMSLNFDGKTNEEIIKTCEGFWQNGSDSEAIINLRLVMNLEKRQLTHLPAHIRHLKKLMILNLNDNQLIALPPEMASLTALSTLQMRGNPLSTESVEYICSSLPRLKNVVIDSQQPNLVELFKTRFPHLCVTVTQILRKEGPI